MRPGRQRDRERFPGLQEEIGEDPARYLDVDQLEDLRLARARIRGIDFIATLRAWRAVERQLGPRAQVVEWLDEREQWLEEHGDRDERPAANRQREINDRSLDWTWSDWPDGERKFNTTDPHRYRAATDGGESE